MTIEYIRQSGEADGVMSFPHPLPAREQTTNRQETFESDRHHRAGSAVRHGGANPPIVQEAPDEQGSKKRPTRVLDRAFR